MAITSSKAFEHLLFVAGLHVGDLKSFRQLLGRHVALLLHHYLVDDRRPSDQQRRDRPENRHHKPHTARREAYPPHIVGICYQFGQYLAEQQYEERQYDCLQQEAEPRRHALKHRSESIVAEYDYCHIDQIVGYKYRGKKPLRIAHKIKRTLAPRRLIELVALLRCKREKCYFTARHEAGDQQGADSHYQSYDLVEAEIGRKTKLQGRHYRSERVGHGW